MQHSCIGVRSVSRGSFTWARGGRGPLVSGDALYPCVPLIAAHSAAMLHSFNGGGRRHDGCASPPCLYSWDARLCGRAGKSMGAGTLNGRRPAAQRVVVTGMGAITSLGLSAESFWESLAPGRSGIGPITLCTTEGYPTNIAAEALDFDPKCYIDCQEARRMTRASQFAVAAARQAVRDAGL